MLNPTNPHLKKEREIVDAFNRAVAPIIERSLIQRSSRHFSFQRNFDNSPILKNLSPEDHAAYWELVQKRNEALDALHKDNCFFQKSQTHFMVEN